MKRRIDIQIASCESNLHARWCRCWLGITTELHAYVAQIVTGLPRETIIEANPARIAIIGAFWL